MGHLECLWECAYQAGDPVLGSVENVEAAAEWDGAAGEFFKAAMECGPVGFIEECPDRPKVFQVHDLFDHAPEYVREAAVARGRAAG